MDLSERIERRRLHRSGERLVVNWEALNPVAHLDEPVGRESVFEALLDAVDPLFDNVLPPNAYVWGPAGSGKSAIVTALASALDAELSGRRTTISTATRAESSFDRFHVVYLDARRATSQFQIYQRTLDAVTDANVPESGVGTTQLRERLESTLASSGGALVVVDHLGEPNGPSLSAVREAFEPLDGVSWVGVGRTPPEDLAAVPATQVHVPAYNYEVVDILTVRSGLGLSNRLDHRHARQIAEWAGGNAHDALAALFNAAVVADSNGATRIRSDDVEAGIAAVPRDGVPVDRVLALSETERRVLELLDATERETTIDATAEEIAARSNLTSGTVKRLLYELAQTGILERIQVTVGREAAGRHPSGIEPQFSVPTFVRLQERYQ